jgi:hypothetical protein
MLMILVAIDFSEHLDARMTRNISRFPVSTSSDPSTAERQKTL